MSGFWKNLAIAIVSLGAFLTLPIHQAFAETEAMTAQIAADTSFILNSSGLVLLMTVGLAFFYGGFVAKKMYSTP